MFEVNAEQLYKALIEDIKVGLTPMVVSSPGMGKSDIVRQIAKDHKLKVIDLRVSQCEPVDMQGFPAVDERGRMTFHIPEYFPIEGEDTPPEGYEGWLIFFDEFNSGNKQTEAACYKIILDKEVYKKKLHPRCAIIAAGNLTSDRAIVNNLSTATMSRLTHYKLQVEPRVWLDWAIKNNIDERIISYIKYKPESLHMFNPKSSESTFPAPRTWHFASRMIKGKDFNDSKVDKELMRIRLAGTIGEGAAVEFMAYSEIYQSLPTIEQILADPKKGWKVPKEPGELYAITTMLSGHITEQNANTIMIALEQLPLEFQVVTMKDIHRRNKALTKNPVVATWIANNADALFGDN